MSVTVLPAPSQSRLLVHGAYVYMHHANHLMGNDNVVGLSKGCGLLLSSLFSFLSIVKESLRESPVLLLMPAKED